MLTLALLPIFLLIAVGLVLRRFRFPDPHFWAAAEKLIYFVLFPALLLERLATADFDRHFLELAPALISALLLAALALGLMQRLLRFPAAVYTSVFQGGLRFNSYIGLAAIDAVLGEASLALAAVGIGIMIPLINILCVLCFARHVPAQAPGMLTTLKTLSRNPLILACFAGSLLNVMDFSFPGPVLGLLEHLGSMALPLGLMCVGAALKPMGLRAANLPVLVSTAFKLMGMPVLFLACGLATQGSPATLQVLLILGSLPTATSSYILARQLGGDARLMALIISIQTLLTILIMPGIMAASQQLTGWS